MFACPSWCGVTVIVCVTLFTLAVATEGLSELTLTGVPGGETVKSKVVGASLGVPFMLLCEKREGPVPLGGYAQRVRRHPIGECAPQGRCSFLAQSNG